MPWRFRTESVFSHASVMTHEAVHDEEAAFAVFSISGAERIVIRRENRNG